MRSVLFLLATTAISGLGMTSAQAQTAMPDAAGEAVNDAGNVAEITVTARRREERLQDVPIAVSTVAAAQIEQTGAYNIARLQQLQPSVQFYSSNPRNSAINIRGLGAPLGFTNDGIEQGVGLYIDQVYYSRAAAATLDFVDVDRVEILRGPQGTLYGKNITAGAVNITTSAPAFDLGGSAEVSLGNLNFRQAKATVTGPLSDKLAARLSFTSTDRDGTIYNVATGQHINGQNSIGVRGALLWKPTDSLRLTLSADYSVQNPICCAQIYAGTGSTQRPANRQYAALTAAQGYSAPSTNAFDRITDLDAQLRARNEFGGASLRAEWDLGGGTLTSVTAFRYWDWKPNNDRDITGLPITPIFQSPSQQRQYTQEFRYARSGDKIDFVAGLFGFYQTIRTQGVIEQGPAASRWFIAPTNALSNNPAVLNGLRVDNDIRFNNASVAVFGQLTWHVTDRLQVQPGLRVNYDYKDGYYNSAVTGTASNGSRQAVTFASTDPWIVQARGVQAPQFFTARYSDWNVSYDLTASYKVAPDVLAYATYARAFKSGGINLNGVPLDTVTGQPQTNVATVKPERVNHWEVGVKTQFWDRRATLNLAGFWTEIGDYQAIVNNGQNAVLRGYLANADKVRVRGLEMDFSVRPSERINAYLNASWIDDEYVRFTNAPCPPELSGGTIATGAQRPGAAGVPGALSPATCDISGQWLPGISKLSASYGVEVNVPATLFATSGQVYAGWDGSYRSKFSSNASRSAYTDVQGYSLNNLRVGFRTGNGFNIYGWVRNVFDQNYYEQLSVGANNTGLIAGQPGDPRTYGLTVKTRF